MDGEGGRVSAAELLAEARWLRRLARSLVDEAAAEDVVQEVYLAALSAPPRGDRPLRPWLATVVRNFVRMRFRSGARRARREQLAAETPAEPLPSPEQLLAEHQARRLLASAVEALDEPFRATVLLCYAEGLAPSEVARRQGLLAGTVRWRLKRGLDLLRDRFAEGLEPVAVGGAAKAAADGGAATGKDRARDQGGAAAGERERRRRAGLAVLAPLLESVSALTPPLPLAAVPRAPVASGQATGAGGPATATSRAAPVGAGRGPAELGGARTAGDGGWRAQVGGGRAAGGRGPASVGHGPVLAGWMTKGAMLMKTKAGIAAGVAALLALVLSGSAFLAGRGSGGWSDDVDVVAAERGAPGPGPGRQAQGSRRQVPPALVAGLELPTAQQPAAGGPGTVEGRVLDGRRRPLGGVALAAVPRSSLSELGSGRRALGPLAQATSDAAGRFRLTGLPVQSYTVSAATRGFDPAYRDDIALSAARPSATGVELVLARGGAVLTGTVKDAGGGVVSGARVVAVAIEGTAVDVGRQHLGRSQADGRYQVHLRAGGRYLVAAEAEGYAQARLEVGLLEPRVVQDLVLEPAAQVSGRVVRLAGAATRASAGDDGRGSGVARAPAAAALAAGSAAAGVADALPAPGATVRLARQDPGGVPFALTAVADQDGAFTFRGVVPGTYGLWARLGPEAGRVERPVAVRAAEVAAGQILRLTAGRAIAGQVKGPDGRPFVDAEIWFEQEEGAWSQERQGESGADGRYRLEGVLPGSYLLFASAPGYRRVGRRISVDAQDLEAVDLALVRGGRLSGRLIRADGGGAPGVRILGLARTGAGQHRMYQVTSGADGHFELVDLAPGTFRIGAEHPEQGIARAISVEIGDGRDAEITLRLEPGATVTGRVLTPEGRPAAGVQVTGVNGPGGLLRRSARTRPDGTFALSALPNGELRLLATSTDLPPGDLPPVPQLIRVPLADGKNAAGLELTLAYPP